MHLAPQSIEQLKTSCTGAVIVPGSKNYDEARAVWNAYIDKYPQIIVQAENVADVASALSFAKDYGLKMAIRGGGHSVAGLSVCDGLVLDLSRMRGVTVDAENKTATAQGGALWADVDAATQAHGLVAPGGVVSETGVGGLTLGGGISWMRRKLGMSIDSLLGAEVVLADGSVVHTSKEEHPDLFWAIRGGGGNFGVVTSFEFQLHELGPEVLFFAAIYPIAEAKNVMRFWHEYTLTAPEEASVDFGIWSIPAHENFPPEAHGLKVVNLFGLYFGDPEQGKKIMEPLWNIPNAAMNISGVYPYVAIQQMNDPYFPKGKHRHYWKSLYLNEINEEIMDKIITRGNQRPNDQCLIYTRHVGGAISRVATDATAFGDRSANYLVSIDSSWIDPADDERVIEWTKAFWDEINHYSNGQVYLNFLGDERTDQKMIQNTFGENLNRLRTVKERYDPTNLFNVNHNISPAHSAGK